MIYHKINTQIEELIKKFDAIPADRKLLLNKISTYVNTCMEEERTAKLIYICTHNSRRSHFGQIWSKVAATYYGFNNVQSYSGGTEATAFNPNAIKAMETLGFIVRKAKETTNPMYAVQFDDDNTPVVCFSKKYDDELNPTQNFCAVMTCMEADGACPYIKGAQVRVATPYIDPKAFDGTPQQDAMYLERSKQIATESLYVFSQIRTS